MKLTTPLSIAYQPHGIKLYRSPLHLNFLTITQLTHTTIYKIDKNKVLLYSTGKYIHYPMINHN